MDVRDAHVGDTVLLMITGIIGKYEGVVVEIDERHCPVIRVEESGPFARLKMGDYILLRKKTIEEVVS